jgi:hypothetical protein
MVFAVVPAVTLAASSSSRQVWATDCNEAQYKPIIITTLGCPF